MADIQPVNWQDLLNVYKTCLVNRLREFTEKIPQANQSGTDSGIANAEVTANPLASILDKIASPNSSGRDALDYVADNGKFQLRHPVSGDVQEIMPVRISNEFVESTISQLINDFNDPRMEFLSLWRFFADRIESKIPIIPTSLATPDNLLINHVDMTTGIWASRQSGESGSAYLSFAMEPVQSFIKQARSVRDLWSGSAILSWLAFQSMKPILERYGPTAFVYPSLRRNPLMDLWLKNDIKLDRVASPDSKYKRCPTIPHRFLALVPWGENGNTAKPLAKLCEEAGKNAWLRLTQAVKDKLHPRFSDIYENWANLWDGQVKNVFSFHISVVPENALNDEILAKLASPEGDFAGVWPDVAKVREFFGTFANKSADAATKQEITETIDKIGRWQTHMGYSASLMESIRSIRHIPVTEKTTDSDGHAPPKCSIYGTWEQMGPAKLSDSRNFWEQVVDSFVGNDINGVRIREREEFCAIALTKRFAVPVKLSNEFDLKTEDLRFSDTATVAAADWLQDVEIEPEVERKKTQFGWSGRWLHIQKGDSKEDVPPELKRRIVAGKKKHGRPPTYYAILKMDGDKLGDRLSGEVTPSLADVLPDMLRKKLAPEYDPDQIPVAKLKRPVCPNLHSSISSALSNFASHLAPDIVDRYNGTVIYSGGDDLLVLMPASKAVECATELRNAYKSGVQDDAGEGESSMRGMGNDAGISAAIVIVHQMEDLRTALQSAREAESEAKNGGRDILNLKIMRRSGVHSSALLPWSEVNWFKELTDLFEDNASNRWAYKLFTEAQMEWIGDDFDDPLRAEIIRIGNRTEDKVWEKFVNDWNASNSNETTMNTGEIIADWWSQYFNAFRMRKRHAEVKLREKMEEKFTLQFLFESFALLCQSAAFVVRAYDDKD